MMDKWDFLWIFAFLLICAAMFMVDFGPSNISPLEVRWGSIKDSAGTP